MAESESSPTPDERAFTKRVAVTAACFAVVLAVSSVGGQNAMKDMLLSQQQASDQWAFYQAKAMRQHLYDLQRQRYDADLIERGAGMPKEARQKLGELVKKAAAQEARYRKEKGGIRKDAEKLEADREVSRTKDPYFDTSGALLQIAIVLASVSLLTTARWLYWFSVGLAALGTILTVNGFLLLFKLAFLH